MSKQTLVLQSFTPPPWPAWRARCMQSVERWARARGYAYRLIGDELFDPIPPAARTGCRGVLLPLTDIGRLIWLDSLLADGWKRVIWLDADILVFDDRLRIPGEAVGREVWLSRGLKSGFRAAESVNNCVLSFEAGGRLLPALLSATLEAAEGFTDAPHPRALGPDLFRRLDAQAPLPQATDLAMASPLMLRAAATGDSAPFAAHRKVWGGPVHAANLCGSMIHDDDLALAAVEAMEANPALWSPVGEAEDVERLSF